MDSISNDNIKHYVLNIIKPFINVIYSEIYPYIWVILFYNIILICIALVNMILLLIMYNNIRYHKLG